MALPLWRPSPEKRARMGCVAGEGPWGLHWPPQRGALWPYARLRRVQRNVSPTWSKSTLDVWKAELSRLLVLVLPLTRVSPISCRLAPNIENRTPLPLCGAHKSVSLCLLSRSTRPPSSRSWAESECALLSEHTFFFFHMVTNSLLGILRRSLTSYASSSVIQSFPSPAGLELTTSTRH